MFQHTAARRRLPVVKAKISPKLKVSTHSRAEAAAIRIFPDRVVGVEVSTHSRAEAAACRLQDFG